MSGTHSRTTDEVSADTSIGRTIGVGALLWIVGVGGGLVVAAVPAFLAAAVGGMGLEDLPPWLAAVSQLLFGVVIFVVGAGYARRWLHGLSLEVSVSESARLILGGVVVAVLVWGVNTAITSLLEIEMPESSLTTISESPAALVLLLGYTAFIAPVAEEVLFRGAIQRRLRHSLGPWLAIGGASIAFLSIHALNFTGGSPLGLGLSFATLYVVSLVYGYIYEQAETIVAPIIVHTAYNVALVAGGLATGL